jgi:hypothetical protein
MTLTRRAFGSLALLAAAPGAARAQQGEAGPGAALSVSAVIGGEATVLSSGLVWRIYALDAAGAPREIAQSNAAEASFRLPPGDYIIHAGYGMASATRRVSLGWRGLSERLSIPAGGIEVRAEVNGRPIPPEDLRIAVFIPSATNREERLVTDRLVSGEVLRLPEGEYHIVSTYGASNASVRADIVLAAGEVIDVLMTHKAARITLKLVSRPGAEALPNTQWNVLTPGGDLVREMVGAFASVVLAEGAYTVIARHDGQTYIDEIGVRSGPDREIEIVAGPR